MNPRHAPAKHALRRFAQPFFSPSLLVLAVGFALSGQALAQTSGAPAGADKGSARPGTNVSRLPSITVSGASKDASLQHLNTPVDSGALGNRTQLETPFSSAVVTSEDIEARQVGKLGDVFAVDASVSDNSGAYGAWASYLTVRGLDLDWQNSFRIDGKPFISYVTSLPYEQFERIELLKGASGFMYGFGSPGGLVNYVTKKPTDQPVRNLSIGYRSDSRWQEQIDLGGRAGQNDTFGYRLNATHEEGGLSNDGSVKRDSVSLALDARLTDRLTWDFQSIYQDMNVRGQEPTIYTGMLTGELPSAVRNDDGTLVGEGPEFNNQFRFYSTGLKFDLAPDWTLSTNYSYSNTKTRRNESVLFLKDSLGNYDDYRSDYGEQYQFNQWQAMLQGKFNTGPLQHQVVLGASWQKQKNYYSSNGVYQLQGTGSLGSQNTNIYHSTGSLNLYSAGQISQKALFASDTVKLTDRWSVLGGLRYTDYSQDGYTVDGDSDSSYDKSGVLTPTLALMYKLAPQTMVYASYMESLEQGASVGAIYSNYGAMLNPLRSKQYELGLKAEHAGWAATAALFRIERKAEYANSDNELVQDGESVYQGLELGASKRLGERWNVGANLMFLDSEYRKGADYIGNRVAGAPKFIAAAQVSYDVSQLPGLTLRADMKYTGSTMLRPANDIKVPGYTIFNIGASYDTIIQGYDTTFRLGVNNLANKRYWMFQYADYIKAGDARSINLNATLRF